MPRHYLSKKRKRAALLEWQSIQVTKMLSEVKPNGCETNTSAAEYGEEEESSGVYEELRSRLSSDS